MYLPMLMHFHLLMHSLKQKHFHWLMYLLKSKRYHSLMYLLKQKYTMSSGSAVSVRPR